MAKLAKGTSITDQEGRKYTLDREIGRGGQGVVWALKESNLAVKIFFRSHLTSDDVIRRIKKVRHLDLEGLPLSVPLVPLANPLVGYIMKLVRGLDPIKKLLKPPANSISTAEWYRNSGGLQWRLRVLAAVAETLARLHAKGLAFADPSPTNILASPYPGGSPRVYLIDADNLMSSSHSGSIFLYTPHYGAPELVRRSRGVSTLSDCHAFAVLAFQVLTLTHPLLGDAVEDGEPEKEAEALAGGLPWIDHPELDSNRSTRGIIPRKLVLSDRLMRLFSTTFEEGLNDPLKRPGMGRWADRLLQAADMTVGCIGCKATFFLKKDEKNCPWCVESPAATARLAKFLFWEPGLAGSANEGSFVLNAKGNPRNFHAVALQNGVPQVIRRRHFFSDPAVSAEDTVGEIVLEGKTARVRNTGSRSLFVRWAQENNGHENFEIQPGEEQRLSADGTPPRWFLHAETMDKPHRALTI